MRTHRIVVAAYCIIAGCSEASEPTNACVPGHVTVCACAGGATGVQTCTPQSIYGPCSCSVSDAEEGEGSTGPPKPQPTAVPVAVSWQPLRQHWSRLFYEGTEYSYTTVPELIWVTASGTRVRLFVPASQFSYEAPEDDWRGGVQTRVVTLKGEWSGAGGPQVFMRYTHGAVGPTIAEEQDLVVYAGIRADDKLLVSMEALPQRDRMQLPGYTKRAIIDWDRASNQPRSLRVWEGETRHVPELFRIRR